MRPILYFTAEIGLDCGLPTYSGGLGVLSGDHVRSAADLGLPLTAISLYYRQGYGRQHLSDDGVQRLDYPATEPHRVLDKAGEFDLELGGERVHLVAWSRRVGGVTVFFLDAGSRENTPEWRAVSEQLYGGDQALRIRQELVLGVGGYALAQRLGIGHGQLHLNEGHTAFAAVAAQRAGESLEVIRARTLFTTHTPVPAGHDRFDLELMGAVAGEAFTAGAGGGVADGVLNMSHLAAHYARAINGVSETNAKVARPLFAGRAIEGLTNGVHHRTWCHPHMAALFDVHLPAWRSDPTALRGAVHLDDHALAEARRRTKDDLIDYANARCRAGLRPELLTLGFARRMTAYKRANLILRDRERLEAVAAQAGGLQLVVAGKAHPSDTDGQALLGELVRLGRDPTSALRVAVIPDYSMWHGRLITGGVDLWLNNPIRPLEASGTSGMKASLQGVPNLSILDGWWVEGCDDEVNGFAFGSAAPERDDEGDAEALYDTLAERVIPLWTKRDKRHWRKMQKAAIATAVDFTSQRMVGEYRERFYAAVK
jgi:starch phosphorylase